MFCFLTSVFDPCLQLFFTALLRLLHLLPSVTVMSSKTAWSCLIFAFSLISAIASFDTHYFLRVPHAWQMIESVAVSPVSLKFNHLTPISFGSTYSRMEQVKFLKDSFKKFEMLWSAWPICFFHRCKSVTHFPLMPLYSISILQLSSVKNHLLQKSPYPGGTGLWQIKKRGWKYCSGSGLLKRRRGLALFVFNFFQVYHFYMLKLLYSLQNCVMPLKKKVFFSATKILWKRVIRSSLKMNLKISHKLR